MNAAIQKVEQEIALIREYRTRLISDVVTGKLDVRGLALPPIPDEPEASEELDADVEADVEKLNDTAEEEAPE